MWLSKVSLYSKPCFFLLSLGGALLLTSCGLRPLYGEASPQVKEGLSAIKISLIEDRSGQLLRNQLLTELTPYGQSQNPLYRLHVNLSWTEGSLSFLKDATVSRYEVILTTHFSLHDMKTDAILTQGDIKTTANYNVIDNGDYSTIVSKENACKQAINLAGQELKLRLGSYFTAKGIS
jgi:LPS-assembly lipoprotein